MRPEAHRRPTPGTSLERLRGTERSNTGDDHPQKLTVRESGTAPKITRATRNEFREVLSRSFVLREIRDIFTGAGFTDEVTYEAWGSRRKLVTEFYNTLNLESYSDVATLLSAVNDTTSLLSSHGDVESLRHLIRRMERDGYRYDNRTFLPRQQQEPAIGGSMTWSLSAYNLICYGHADASVFRTPTGNGTFPADRLFEYTSDDLKRHYEDDISLLASLPALVVAEAMPGGDPETPALLAQLENVRADGNDIRFRFRRVEAERFSSEEIFGSDLLDIKTERWEHSRTHWAIKEGALVEGLLCLLANRVGTQARRFPSIAQPRFFRVDEWPLPTLGHVAVMMPFDSAYNAVYKTIRRACRHHDLNAIRVDEIFGPRNVVDDIFTTIVQSRFVISDLTRRNPNVLYETGIAHARNCEVVMIVQNEEDIPFDLRHIRYVTYLPNSEGYSKLQTDLEKSIGVVLDEAN